MLSFKERANWTPAEARAQFRQNFFPFVQSGGIAAPYTQVSVHFVPSAEAKLFAEFCRVNHAPCPVVYQSEPGQVTAPPIAADLDIRQVIVYYISNYILFQHTEPGFVSSLVVSPLLGYTSRELTHLALSQSLRLSTKHQPRSQGIRVLRHIEKREDPGDEVVPGC